MITVPSAGEYGLIIDALPQELPVNGWSYAQNMRFRDGYAERFRGSSPVLTTPPVIPYWIAPYRNANSKFWIHAGVARVYSDDGSTQTDLTPTTAYAGAIDDRWTGGSAQGVMVINNGVDLPQFWAGNVATKFAPLTGWNAVWRCASIRPFKNYLVALDVTKSGTRFGNMVKWSAAANPGALPPTWDETDATKDAGEQDLAETTDFMVDSMPLGDLNIIYKERSMYGMQYIGGTFVWRFFRLPGDVGMLARGCVVNTPKGHVVMTPGDVILHNGQGPQSIVNGRMRRWLFNNIDTTYFARSFLCVNQARNEVWICFPEGGQTTCTLALVWNWETDTFGIRNLPNATFGGSGSVVTASNATWAADTETWAVDATTWNNDGFSSTETRLLISGAGPLVSLMETGALFNGVAPTCTLERTGMSFDKPDVVKTVRAVIPRLDATPGTVVNLQVGGSMDAEVAPTWSAPVSYTVGSTYKADFFATGRFLSFRITSTSAQPWRLKSFDVEMQGRGKY